MYRSHTCGELRISDINKQVTLSGWVQRSRKMGGMTFIDLRDRYGITQLVFNEEVDAELCEQANHLGREFVIQIVGTVNERFSKNKNIPTGDIEIIVSELNVLNSALTPPFTIEDNTDGGDDIRMKYRYLDLRRATVRKNLELRHKMTIEVRKYLDSKGFIEVETPLLIGSTPEGARDFVVPSRMNPGQFYALPQSPQTLKQLLMVSGFDRYFQTALKACEDIQQIGGIRLLPDFKEVFTYDNKGNDEVLMAINYKKVEASNNYFDMMHISAATLSPDIEPDILETIGAGGGLMELSPSKHLRAQYSEEDSRRDVTFLEIYKTKDGGRSYYGTMAMKCRGIVESGVRYFVDDIILYRYADVLLMKAEAKNGLKQDPTAEMEEVRQRAYGENYANHKFVNGTPEENDAAILQERLLEFATECKRWWDLVRFDKAFELVPSLVGRDNQELLYFPIPNSVLSLEPLVEPNSAWPM